MSSKMDGRARWPRGGFVGSKTGGLHRLAHRSAVRDYQSRLTRRAGLCGRTVALAPRADVQHLGCCGLTNFRQICRRFDIITGLIFATFAATQAHWLSFRWRRLRLSETTPGYGQPNSSTGIEFHWGAAAGARRSRRLRNGAIARDWRHDRQNAPRRHGILHRALGRHLCAACPLFVAPNRSRSARARLPIAAMFIDEGREEQPIALAIGGGSPREAQRK
jgi:hypothetical protein